MFVCGVPLYMAVRGFESLNPSGARRGGVVTAVAESQIDGEFGVKGKVEATLILVEPRINDIVGMREHSSTFIHSVKVYRQHSHILPLPQPHSQRSSLLRIYITHELHFRTIWPLLSAVSTY